VNTILIALFWASAAFSTLCVPFVSCFREIPGSIIYDNIPPLIPLGVEGKFLLPSPLEAKSFFNAQRG
jgi:hypothetical protein